MRGASDDFTLEQTIFLGGQISQKYPAFKDIARMTPDYATLYRFIEMLPELEAEQDETKIALSIIELLGEADFVRQSTEITRLSMVMGDTRKHIDVKSVMDELRKSRSDTST